MSDSDIIAASTRRISTDHINAVTGRYIALSVSYTACILAVFNDSPGPLGHKIILKGAVSYQVELGDDIYGNITRINNALGKIEDQLGAYRVKRDNLQQQMIKQFRLRLHTILPGICSS